MAVVVYCIACDSVRPHRANPVRMTISGLLGHFRSRLTPPYPVRCAEFSVLLMLAELDSEIEISMKIVQDSTQALLYQTPPRYFPVGGGAAQLLGMRFRIQDVTFPAPGLYWIECWNYGTCLHRQRMYAVT